MKKKQDALIDALNYISAENIFHIPSGGKKKKTTKKGLLAWISLYYSNAPVVTAGNGHLNCIWSGILVILQKNVWIPISQTNRDVYLVFPYFSAGRH